MALSDIKEELIRLEECRRDAWVERDARSLDDLMADDFIEINYFGRTPKRDILEDLFPKLTLNRFEMEDYELVAASEAVATPTYHCYESITFERSEVHGEFHVAATYRRQDGRWWLLLWQITPFNG
jgi:hypothetical protein